MTLAGDYRDAASLDRALLSSSGRFLGKRLYWKLYFIENALRVVINSVLSLQFKTRDWIPSVTTKKERKRIEEQKRRSTGRHNVPGKHDVYYLYLSQLTKIISFNSHQFDPVVPDIDNWVVKLEHLAISRNLIAHANWPNTYDLTIIEETHRDMVALLDYLKSKGVILTIP